jgi:tRNA threonylcarbamoyl adenosine modification protein YeaZ
MAAMLILALDTTNERGGAGIFRDGDSLAMAENDGRANYSVLIFEMVERLLSETRLKLADVDLFAISNGPGSFTGIRVGVAAAQGWATALGRPVCGVSELAALAIQAHPRSEWAASLLDARRGELYAGLFRRLPGSAAASARHEAQGEGWISKPGDLAEAFSQKLPASANLTCLVREHDQAAQRAAEALPAAIRRQVVPGLLVPAIARIAAQRSAEGKVQSPAELDACYIRRTDAELHLRE